MPCYGEETRRALGNFDLGGVRTRMELIYAVVEIKKAAALTYARIDPEKAALYEAVAGACDRVLSGEADESFPLQALQGGAGTSTNMNVNEVLASLASEKLGRRVHPLDDVNRGQSTNDVYPTALRIAAIRLLRQLAEECAALQESLQKRENEYADIRKLGRTELMDAVPVTLGEEFGAYAQAIARDRWRLYKVEERLRQVNLGGTAVGLSDNAERRYRYGVVEELRKLTDIGLAAAEYPMDVTQNCDVFVEVSGLLKALAVNLMKIANDLRLMNAGPHGGLGEIRLAPMQRGSTIMPGKVNPVIAEMTMEVSMRVIANDCAITEAAARGELELNAFLPLIADCLLEDLTLLKNAVRLFRERCVDLIEPDAARCRALLEASAARAASYVPALGYDAVAEAVEQYGGSSEVLYAELERRKAAARRKK